MRAFLSCLALIVAWALLSSSALVTATPSCSALYDNPTQKYSAGALLATKSVRPRIYGIDGENHCCFFCE